MILGSVYLMWFAGSFFGPFESFLIFLGVPLAAWAGAFVADSLLRKQDYVGGALFEPQDRYGTFGWPALGSMVVGAIVGWGLVTPDSNSSVLAWQGFLFDLSGVDQQSIWREADLGVIVALLIGFTGTGLLGRGRVQRQEALAV